MISLNDKKAGFPEYIQPRIYLMTLSYFSTLAHHVSNHPHWWIW